LLGQSGGLWLCRAGGARRPGGSLRDAAARRRRPRPGSRHLGRRGDKGRRRENRRTAEDGGTPPGASARAATRRSRHDPQHQAHGHQQSQQRFLAHDVGSSRPSSRPGRATRGQIGFGRRRASCERDGLAEVGRDGRMPVLVRRSASLRLQGSADGGWGRPAEGASPRQARGTIAIGPCPEKGNIHGPGEMHKITTASYNYKAKNPEHGNHCANNCPTSRHSFSARSASGVSAITRTMGSVLLGRT
jgi:hypothetical protein